MSQINKSEIQKAFVADFRHQGTFNNKEGAVSNTLLSDLEQPTKEYVNFDDLIFSKREPLSEQRIDKRINELKAATAKEFDFTNEFEISKELKSLTETKKQFQQKEKKQTRRATAGAIASDLYAVALYALIVLGFTTALILDGQTTHDNQPKTTTTVQHVVDAVRLDKVAKEAFHSTVEFGQGQHTLAAQQLSRMGQAVLSLTEPSKTVRTDDTNMDTLIGNANTITNNNGDKK